MQLKGVYASTHPAARVHSRQPQNIHYSLYATVDAEIIRQWRTIGSYMIIVETSLFTKLIKSLMSDDECVASVTTVPNDLIH